MVSMVSNGGGSPTVFFGLSTDDKPVNIEIVVGNPKPIPNASFFYEMDTKKIYMWDADGTQWLEQ